jgi:hypothetical protein
MDLDNYVISADDTNSLSIVYTYHPIGGRATRYFMQVDYAFDAVRPQIH